MRPKRRKRQMWCLRHVNVKWCYVVNRLWHLMKRLVTSLSSSSSRQ